MKTCFSLTSTALLLILCLSGCPGIGDPEPGITTPPPVWFTADFEDGTSSAWDLTPPAGASFSVVTEPGTANKVLRFNAGTAVEEPIALLKDTVWAEICTLAGDPELSDYYFEARLKPQLNTSSTANKQLYLMGRYQDDDNWYLGGFNLQTSETSRRVELGYRKAGAISRPVQVNQTIEMGTQGQAGGQWYTVRLELNGSEVTVYLDGTKMGTISDTAFSAGKVGLFTYNRDFLIDDIVIGDPAVKPVQLALDPPELNWVAEAGSAAYQVVVTAVQDDGSTPDTFSVVSSNPDIVGVEVDGNIVSLLPLAEGEASITFTSGSAPNLTRVISATITPPYVDPPATYTGFSTAVYPAPETVGVYPDEKLVLNFDDAPLLGSGGSIVIFDVFGEVVDVISVLDEINLSGPQTGTGLNGTNFRSLNVAGSLISIEGTTVTVTLHNNSLAYNSEYSVGIAEETFSGTFCGVAFAGIGSAAGWTFTTGPDPVPGSVLSVDDTGTTADFRTVQGALDYVMLYKTADEAITIDVADGIYSELLYLRGKNNLSLVGQSREGTIIQFENYDALNGGSSGRPLWLVESCDNLTLETLTIRNTHLRSGSGDQAETLYFNNTTGKFIARNVVFSSEQDTLNLKGYNWFYNCLIEGNTDFIWGASKICLFEACEIRTIGDSKTSTPSGGYLVQSRTQTATDRGYVFLDCDLTNAPGRTGTLVATGATYLARSGGSTSYYDNVVYINCAMDTHLAVLGWAGVGVNGQPAPNPAVPDITSGWKEYGSTSPGGTLLDLTGRSTAAYIMTAGEYAANYADRATIFSSISWNPQP